MTKQYTDRELLKSCVEAMEVSQRDGGATDWRHMIAALREHLAVEPKATQRCAYVGMYDVQCGLDAGHEGAHRIFGPHQNRRGDE